MFKLTLRDRNARTVVKKAFEKMRDESDGSGEHRWKCCRRRDYEDSAFLVLSLNLLLSSATHSACSRRGGWGKMQGLTAAQLILDMS